MTSELQADVAILMPKTTDFERFSVRYAGLSHELGALGVGHCFVESHTSFNAAEHGFADAYDIQRSPLMPLVQPRVVRDLTMSLKPEQLYADQAIMVVHHPETNLYIADKRNMLAALPEFHPATLTISEDDLEMAFDLIAGNKIVVKPVTGMASKGVHILDKPGAVSLEPGTYLAQEFIDTLGGIPEHTISGAHNVRVISIGNKAVAGIARQAENNVLADDYYGAFVEPDDLSPTMQDIVGGVHDVLATKPGQGNNVIAIDMMRGVDAHGEVRDVLCEVNRRPLRISAWDLRDNDNLSREAVAEVARRWDKAEAAMLASLVD